MKNLINIINLETNAKRSWRINNHEETVSLEKMIGRKCKESQSLNLIIVLKSAMNIEVIWDLYI